MDDVERKDFTAGTGVRSRSFDSESVGILPKPAKPVMLFDSIADTANQFVSVCQAYRGMHENAYSCLIVWIFLFHELVITWSSSKF